MKNKIIIHWFRKDLRLHDNPSLYYALKEGLVLPVFILDITTPMKYQIGSASKIWLHNSLLSLQKSLDGHLYCFRGDATKILFDLIKKYKAQSIYWNRCYDPWSQKIDKKIEQKCINNNILVKTFNGSLLWEPWYILKKDGTPYKVYSSFYNQGVLMSKKQQLRSPFPTPKKYIKNTIFIKENTDITSLLLLPQYTWYKKLEMLWDIGEKCALSKFNLFFNKKLNNYKNGRNDPNNNSVSFFSPHLQWGEISPFLIWQKISVLSPNINENHFMKELVWREFSYYLLYHFPFITEQNLQKKFDLFPWQINEQLFIAWKKGLTGYPIVDAGMRQLWNEGYINNRIRMIVASFLIKNLLIHWHYGAKWFLDCLVDADLANNSANWQWVAGSGAHSSPYFRIFNPIKQGLKFDKEGLYTKKYIPELKKIPEKFLFSPWLAPKNILKDANVILGKTYPYPIVNFIESRNSALKYYYRTIKQKLK